MENRLKFHELLKNTVNLKSIYFQPPENLKIDYPCIIYERMADKTSFANDIRYLNKKKYKITIIDRNPDSDLCEKIASLRYSYFDRHFVSNNLNHDVYNIYY